MVLFQRALQGSNQSPQPDESKRDTIGLICRFCGRNSRSFLYLGSSFLAFPLWCDRFISVPGVPFKNRQNSITAFSAAVSPACMGFLSAFE